MNEHIQRHFEMSFPWIAEIMIECEKNEKWDYRIKTSDGKIYIYDFLDNSCIEVPSDSSDIDEEYFKRESGRRIYRMMRGRHITESELSEKSGITQSMISRYITGKSIPSFYNIAKIAKVLDCSIDELKYY